jgi:hypothetical protein
MLPPVVSEFLVGEALGDAVADAAAKGDETLISDDVASSEDEDNWTGVVNGDVDEAADESTDESIAMLEDGTIDKSTATLDEGALAKLTLDGSVEARMLDCAIVGWLLGGAITAEGVSAADDDGAGLNGGESANDAWTGAPTGASVVYPPIGPLKVGAAVT